MGLGGGSERAGLCGRLRALPGPLGLGLALLASAYWLIGFIGFIGLGLALLAHVGLLLAYGFALRGLNSSFIGLGLLALWLAYLFYYWLIGLFANSFHLVYFSNWESRAL